MGSPVYDFLLDSFLFDDDRLEDGFRQESEEELEKELNRYREYCIANATAMEEEVRARRSVLKMVVPTGGMPASLLKQGGLYVEQYVVDDPLFRLGYRRGPEGDAAAQMMGFGERTAKREEIVEAVRYLKQITPMVAADYVKVLPFSLLFEPPSKVPIRVPDSSLEVSEAVKWLQERATIHPVEAEDGRVTVLPSKPSLAPRGRIAVRFDGTDDIYPFQYMQMQVLDVDKDSRRFRAAMNPERPDRRTFEHWKVQSVRSAAENYHRRLGIAAQVAASLDAAQVVQTPLEFSLLKRIYGIDHTLQVEVADALLRIELPFLEGLSAEAIMSVRRDYGEEFANFRVELERQLREFATMDDQQAIAKRAREVAHELGTVQARHLENELKTLRERTIFKPAAIGLATLGVSALLANPFGVAAAAVGAVGVAANVLVERRAGRRRHPGFFLWEAQRRSRR